MKFNISLFYTVKLLLKQLSVWPIIEPFLLPIVQKDNYFDVDTLGWVDTLGLNNFTSSQIEKLSGDNTRDEKERVMDALRAGLVGPM